MGTKVYTSRSLHWLDNAKNAVTIHTWVALALQLRCTGTHNLVRQFALVFQWILWLRAFIPIAALLQ